MLYIVATPIGHSDDISFRAIEVLKSVSLIACEDTRTSDKILSKYGITTAKTSFHLHNEHKKSGELINRVKQGDDIALITDAGMPGISDPGFLLIREAYKQNVRVTVIPGADALTTALIASGFPSDRFCFEGFLPHKKGRKTRIEQWIHEDRTIVLYESVHRVLKLLGELESILGPDRMCAVCREMTKHFEEIIRGTISEVKIRCENHSSLKGEFVIVIAKPNYTE